MSFLFTCPHCQTQTMVDDQYLGPSGQCVVCGRAIQLPAAISRGPAKAGKPNDMRVVRWVIAGTIAVAFVATLGVLAARYGGQGVRTLQTNRLRGQCLVNLQKVATALNAYARDYGSYPPPTTFAEYGKTPQVSWRVLVLPYLGYQSLYDEYRLEEPWNSQHNQMLVEKMPREYRSPASAGSLPGEASYFLITGNGTLFPDSGPLGPGKVVDDPTKTILLVETAFSPLNTLQWTEPGDFALGAISMNVNSGMGIGGSHAGGVTVATVSGSSYWLRESADSAVLRALITPAGGEAL